MYKWSAFLSENHQGYYIATGKGMCVQTDYVALNSQKLFLCSKETDCGTQGNRNFENSFCLWKYFCCKYTHVSGYPKSSWKHEMNKWTSFGEMKSKYEFLLICLFHDILKDSFKYLKIKATERRCHLSPACPLSRWPPWPRLDRSQEGHRIPHMESSGPNIWTICHCFSQANCRELNQMEWLRTCALV